MKLRNHREELAQSFSANEYYINSKNRCTQMKIKNWNAIQTSRDISSDYQEQTWQDIRKGLFTFVPTSIVVVLEDHYGLN